jgi:hypothetical protein
MTGGTRLWPNSVFYDNLSAEVPTFYGIIRSSVSVTVPADKLSINAAFRPNFGYTLEEAAQVGEFHHFNWLNLVRVDTYLSSPLRYLNDNLKDRFGHYPTVPYTDPPSGGYEYQREECSTLFRPCEFPVQDALPWYLDEEYTLDFKKPTDSSEQTQLEGSMMPFGRHTSLSFEDRPNALYGNRIEFRTSLVGVRSDGSGHVLDVEGTRFDWYAIGADILGNVNVQGFEVRGNVDPSLVGSVTVGFAGFVPSGVFDPEELALYQRQGIAIYPNVPAPVPEPATFLLMASGLAVLVLLTRKRRGMFRG